VAVRDKSCMVSGRKFHVAGKNVTPYTTEDTEILQQQIIDNATNQFTDAFVLPSTPLTAYLSTDCKMKYSVKL